MMFKSKLGNPSGGVRLRRQRRSWKAFRQPRVLPPSHPVCRRRHGSLLTVGGVRAPRPPSGDAAGSDFGEGLLEVGLEVREVLDADGEAYVIRGYAAGLLFVGGELAVGGARRMDGE
jgi:hypothetical protein